MKRDSYPRHKANHHPLFDPTCRPFLIHKTTGESADVREKKEAENKLLRDADAKKNFIILNCDSLLNKDKFMNMCLVFLTAISTSFPFCSLVYFRCNETLSARKIARHDSSE